MASFSRLPKLRYLILSFPLVLAELPEVYRAFTATKFAPEVSSEYCRELFSHVLAGQTKCNSQIPSIRGPLEMLVIKVGEWEMFDSLTQEFCMRVNKYIQVCRRIDGALRTWYVEGEPTGYRDEQFEDILIRLGFAVPWDTSRTTFKIKGDPTRGQVLQRTEVSASHLE